MPLWDKDDLYSEIEVLTKTLNKMRQQRNLLDQAMSETAAALGVSCDNEEILEAIHKLKYPEWQPFSTAPRDGTLILATCNRVFDWYQVVYYDESCDDGRTCHGGWNVPEGDLIYGDGFHTHWMPLPKQPKD